MKLLVMSDTRLSLASDWEDVKSKIKETNIDITDDDLRYEEGNEDDLLDRLSKKMNRSKDDVKAYIESVSATKRVAG
jgi:uncharacterized protein YjbJ (UPF0337 family)